MENEEPKIVLSAKEFIRAMQDGYSVDVKGETQDFREVDYYLISGVKVTGKMDYTNKDFSQLINIDNCEIENLIFRNCTFEKGLEISQSVFTHDANFSRCKFHGPLSIDECRFDNKVRCSANTFTDYVQFNDCIIQRALTISRNTMSKGLYIVSTDIHEGLVFNYGKIEGDLRIVSSKIVEEIHLEKLEVNGATSLDNVQTQEMFLSASFPSNSRVDILNCTFGSVVLPYTIPEKLSFKILLTKFKSISTPAAFTNLGYMQWNNLQPNGNAAIEIQNAVMGKWDIINCDFENTELIIYSSKITDAFYTNSKFPPEISVPKIVTDKKKGHDILRDGYNQLKTLAQKQNDRKMFLHYQAEEMRSFNNTITLKSHTATKIQLFFMWLSNDYGTNWVRAVCFTATLNLIFLGIAFCGRPFDISQAGTFAGQYFSFLLALTTKPDFIKSNQEIIAFSISRIFIAFGIYQTISAFRKFGKGEN